jgi:hypothetical protein
MSEVCKFKFKNDIKKSSIENQIALAIITAECTFGQARVRLHASYAVSDGQAVIDVSNEVGENIAQVFTGLMIKSIGEENFSVEKIRETGRKIKHLPRH